MKQKESLQDTILDSLPVGVILFSGTNAVKVNRHAIEHFTPDLASADLLLRRFEASAAIAEEDAHPKVRMKLGGVSCYIEKRDVCESRALLLIHSEQCAASGNPEDNGDFAEIFNNSYDGIFVTDGHGTILELNEGCERNYDIRAADFVGKNVYELERLRLISPVIAPKVITTKRRVTEMQTTWMGKRILVTGIPLLDEEGRVRKVIVNSRDTTELITLKEQLAKAQEKLEQVETEVRQLRVDTADAVDGIIIQSPPMRQVIDLALRVAKVDATVLIYGESGVGKEIVTRLIHHSSPRASGPLIKLNCGAIPRELLESELFGYEGGAFTGARRQGKIGMFELAAGGTLFLDEIGELPLDMQAKLLQVLQDRTIMRVGGTRATRVDFRIVAATNRNLGDMVREKQFRKDLYFRLSVVSMSVPPLRERTEDVIPLIHAFLAEFNQQYGLNKRFSARAISALLRYGWPGNVREVRNVVERLVVTAADELIEDVALSDPFDERNPDIEPGSLKERVAKYEEELLRDAHKRLGNTRAVAKEFDISQSTVVRKLTRPPD